MTYDDLHLIRQFSSHELIGAFHGNWDADDIEVRGFRPLFPLFNHLRYWAFGEHVLAHRLFILFLYALTIGWLTRPLARFGIRPACLALGACLAISSRYSVYHYAFLTDGAHVMQGALFALALGGTLRWVDDGLKRGFAGAVAAVVLGLLLREDTLSIVPVLCLAAVIAGHQTRATAQRVLALVAVIAAVCAVLLLYRGFAVPHLPRVAWDFHGVATAVARSFRLVGLEGFDVTSRVSVAVGRWLPVLLLVPLVARRRGDGARVLVLAAAALVACAPALVVGRENLLFFPILFVAIAYGTAIASTADARPVRWAPAIVAASVIALGEVYVAREFQLSFHPFSSTSLHWSGEFVYGPYATATIPPGRRQQVIDRLASIGIRDEGQFVEKLPRKTFTALIEGPWKPTGEPRLFVPRLAPQAFRP